MRARRRRAHLPLTAPERKPGFRPGKPRNLQGEPSPLLVPSPVAGAALFSSLLRVRHGDGRPNLSFVVPPCVYIAETTQWWGCHSQKGRSTSSAAAPRGTSVPTAAGGCFRRTARRL
uniref:Uncharacterized protein n=1 Tax=Arundo donax TaxID=35708 RepID=A0A0A9E3Q7_ARUDO